MKKISAIILCVCLLLTLMSIPAEARPIPTSKTPYAPDTDILDVAATRDGGIMYAAGAGDLIPNITGTQSLVKSTDGGTSWMATGFDGGVVSRIALAPDSADGSVLAVIADNNEVWFSGNGGTYFSQAGGFTATNIRSVAISPLVGGVRQIAIAADDSVRFYTTPIDPYGAGVWIDIMALPSANVIVGPVLAVEFSPNYSQDRTLAVITTDATSTRLNLYYAMTQLWNYSYLPYGMDNYGLVISGTVATAADICMPGSYFSFDSASRVHYVALNSGGLYRNSYQLSTVDMKSVAVNAAGDKLVAGACNTNDVFRIYSPTTALPDDVLSAAANPGATTSSNVTVALSGTSIIAGTSGVGSAFSTSDDDGMSFNDISLIDGTRPKGKN